MDMKELKTLLITTKQSLNKQLSLKRSKEIKYADEQYFELITFASLWNTAGEDSSKVMNEIDDVPSGDALMQQLQKFNLQEVEDIFNSVYEKQFRKQFKKKKKPKAIAIIDMHEQETYNKQRRTLPANRGGKHKNGTHFFFKFATIQVMVADKIITLGVKLHERNITQRQLVIELIKRAQKFVKIKMLLLDRGFREVQLLNELEQVQVPILMPCIKDEKTKKELTQAKGKFTIIKTYWKNKKGEQANYKLLIIKLSNGTELGFCTTIKFPWLRSAKYYLNLYAKRWNIETGYRLQNQFLPKTTCIKDMVRYFYFCYAVAMHNLWLSIRNTIGKKIFTVMRMKFTLTYFWITTHLNPEL